MKTFFIYDNNRKIKFLYKELKKMQRDLDSMLDVILNITDSSGNHIIDRDDYDNKGYEYGVDEDEDD